jgi:hypothetical protein
MPDEIKSYALIPEAGNPNVGKEVFNVLGKIIADKVRLGLHDRWFRNYQLRRNQHWKGKSPQGVPLVSANLLYTHIQRTTNTMTDNDPCFNVAAVGRIEENQKEQLSDLQRCTEHWWRDQEQQDVFETSCINGEQYGIAVEKVIFNPDIEFRLGEVEALNIDPFHFGVYPVKLAATRDLQKSEAIAHFYPVSVRAMKSKYPDKAKEIKADSEILKDLKDDDRREIIGSASSGKGSIMTSIANTVRELLNFVSGTGSSEDEEETLLCELWVRDKSQVTKETVNEAGEQVKVTQPKYTGEIRYILACSGGVVLEDKDNPNINPSLSEEEQQATFLYDKFPFSCANSVKDTSNFWGLSDYEQLEWLNMEVNKSLSQLVLEKDRSARKKLINPKDSGVPNEHFINFTSIISPSSTMAAQGIRWLETPPASIDYDKAIALFKDFFFLVSGTFEMDQAQGSGRDVIAYKAIAALLERAATMMRGKIRAYSRLIRDRGRMYLSHVMNFYTEERWITYKDKQGKEASKPIIGSSMIMPAKLTVVSGSTLPISRIQQREEALSLFEKQAIDQTELLDKLDWSNRNEVITRMQQGPMGQIIQKLMMTGMPAQIGEYAKFVGQNEPKDIEKALADGQLPPFMDFIKQLLAGLENQGADPAQQAQFEAKNQELKKLAAEVEKVVAERDLLVEKAMTEKVDQQVKLAGVQFDDQTMQLQRAKAVAEIEAEAAGRHMEGVKTGLDFVSKQNNKPGFNEKGKQSDNVSQ